MVVCPYDNLLTSCTLAECVLAKELSEDAMDSFFLFLEIFRKEKKEIYDQLIKNCHFFEKTVEEILNNEVSQVYKGIYS